MIEIEIPQNIAEFEIKVFLSNEIYYLSFLWNQSAHIRGLYFMTIMDRNRKKIVSSVPLYEGGPVADIFAARPRMPKGIFGVIDVSGKGEQADLENFGDSVKLVYVDG